MKSLTVVQFAAMAVVMLALLEVGVTTATEGSYREKKGKLGMSVLEALKKYIIDREQERELEVRLGESLRHTDTEKKTNNYNGKEQESQKKNMYASLSLKKEMEIRQKKVNALLAEKRGVCTSEQFSCSNGRCIVKGWTCDGWNDCGDSSDEKDCVCTTEQIACSSGGCIPKDGKCDGWGQCEDGSDEQNCVCQDHQFACSSGGCIPKDGKCDGGKDCEDGSDEKQCPCTADQFRCANGRCIRKSYECDYYGMDDCGDYSDEQHCVCKTNQFSCSNGGCIPLTWKCDGTSECKKDNSDEENCG